jgi:hypothetical protein
MQLSRLWEAIPQQVTKWLLVEAVAAHPKLTISAR